MDEHYLDKTQINVRKSPSNIDKLIFLLITVLSIELTSALKTPPQSLSSHIPFVTILSATLAHPIRIQSLLQEFGELEDPPPTMEFTAVFELPDNVKDLERLLAGSGHAEY